MRRASAGLAARGIGLVACAALAWGCVAVGMARTLALSDPARALAWSPGDAPALALLGAARLGPAPSPAGAAEAGRLSRAALRRDPTIVVAARTLGLLADMAGDRPRARRLMAYAQSLSRRDLPTQYWFIEERVAAGDVAGALRHYDTALRASAAAEPLLIPVLLAAIADPAAREGLADRLVADPIWRASFLDKVAHDAPADAAGTLALSLAARRHPLDPAATRDLLARLVAAGDYARAAAVRAAAGGGDPRRGPWPRDGGFGRAGDLPPFDWVLAEDGDTRAERVADGAGAGRLAFSTPADKGGEVARQLLLLPPGDWRLSSRFTVSGSDTIGRPYWQLSCAAMPDAPPLLRLDLAPAAGRGDGGGVAEGGFTVPAGCAAQWLSLTLRASDRIDGVEGQVESVTIGPRR